MEDKKVINPDIKVIQFGKRELKEFTAYPLSMHDQEELTNLFIQTVLNISKLSEEDFTDVGKKKGKKKVKDDKVFIREAINVITDNLPVVLKVVGDLDSKEEAAEILGQFTNNQLSELIDYIWETNFEVIVKNVRSLVGKIQKMFPSAGQSETFLEHIPSTGTKMSTEKAGEKGD